jgi:polysaccharide chain length determinant protein (PEP-CTERM system associated)
MTGERDNRTIIETAIEIWNRRKWLMIVSFLAVFGLVAGLVTALPDLYRSSATLIAGQDDVAESIVENNVSTELELRLGIIRQALMSRGQLQSVIEQFDLYPELRKVAPPASVIEQLRQDIDIRQEPYAQPQWGQSATYSVEISYRAWDPELASLVANDLARRFMEENDRNRSSQATRATEIIREQLRSAREEFQAQEQRITDFRNEHMGNLPEQQQVNLATLERLNSELLQNGERQMQLATRRQAALAGAAAGNAGGTSTVVSDRLRLEQLKQQLEQMRGQFTDSHPEIIRLEREVQSLSLQLASAPPEVEAAPETQSREDSPAEIDRDMARLRADERRLKSEIDALTARIESVPRIEQQLERLNYEYDTARDEYLEMQKRYQDALLAQSLEVEQSQEVKIVEVAIPPDFPAAPNRTRLLFVGLMLAGGFAAGMLVLAEQLNKTFHSTRDLRKFTRIPVLATIGNIQTDRDRWMAWARFGLNTVLVAAGLFLLTAASYHLGQGSKGVVLAIAG